MTPLLSVSNLSFHPKRHWLSGGSEDFVLAPVNFELHQGETMAIIGENGSGKSLLARLLVGVETPSGGQIALNGETLVHSNRRLRYQRIRMIFQHSKGSLNPALTLGVQLEEALLLNTQLDEQERQRKIQQVLTQVGLLPDHQHFYRHMLSEGQHQRAAIARALILDPEIVIADEPFAALDPSVRSQTVNLLLKLQKDLGIGFIFISHNLGIVRHMSDRVLVLSQGKVVESGKSEVVFSWPKSECTQKLMYAYQSLTQK
ncbi:Methionine import ATP-binding protein MetN [Saliniradius amylolyticus]|uniref:Methionine import ATP-binding protein MetN n=1 Tax=Saliniradius amylolyticus TaxID=2183582 RepID=A0A2S2E103_9ALTE|nr:ATP-binding cassette domain-containing protein [Saliniradius amylolyticus]AWL11328.1 Methionine import ATP-binding protein MetN [Saliniradius amylolyticus]